MLPFWFLCGNEVYADLGLMIPITLVLDNARYQKCKIVEELALSLSIELLYLPSR